MKNKMNLLLTLVVFPLCLAQELFRNPNFEEPFDGQNNWWCNTCDLDKSLDAYEGTQSGRIRNSLKNMVTNTRDHQVVTVEPREADIGISQILHKYAIPSMCDFSHGFRIANWAGVWQHVPVVAGRSYQFNARLKILNQLPGRLYHRAEFMVNIDYVEGGNHYHWISNAPYLMESEGWTRVGGDFQLADTEILEAKFYIQFPDAEINYLIDAASLTEILPNPNWEVEANNRIENIRKRNIEIRLDADFFYDTSLMDIQVRQISHDFPFGSAVNADFVAGTDTPSMRYKSVFYDHFNWAVIENALKWRQMEWNKGEINYARPEGALDVLNQNGIPTRGHCVVWGVDDNVPEWVKPLDGNQVRAEVSTRVQGVVNRMKGRVVHWDVNNEQLHGDFFENKTGDPWYTENIFREVAAVDPDVKLFFNEYHIVSQGHVTDAYVEQVKHAIANGVPVYGIGAQSHMPESFNIEDVKRRLDHAATAGLPIWITEMTVPIEDRTLRADGYEDLLRMYFSHPAVEGILLWGFWDGAHWKPNAALFEGDNFEINEAGLRYRDLVFDEWITDTTLFPVFNIDTMNLRGFHGNYTLTVNYLGLELTSQQFSVPKGPGSVVVNVRV